MATSSVLVHSVPSVAGCGGGGRGSAAAVGGRAGKGGEEWLLVVGEVLIVNGIAI